MGVDLNLDREKGVVTEQKQGDATARERKGNYKRKRLGLGKRGKKVEINATFAGK